jgi:hypothetical protein
MLAGATAGELEVDATGSPAAVAADSGDGVGGSAPAGDELFQSDEFRMVSR